MPNELLRTDYPDDVPHKVSGRTLNAEHRAINAMQRRPIQRGTGGVDGLNVGPVPFKFGIAVITPAGAAGSCPADATEFSGYGFPCPVQNKYTAEFRYYDTDEGIWKKYGEVYEVEAAVYYEPTDSQASKAPQSGPGFGPIPSYLPGDVTPAYLDVQRGKIIPVQSPNCDDPSGVFFTNIEQALETVPFVPAVAEFYLEIFRPTVDADFITVGVIAFPLLYPDLQGGTYDSSSVFNTFPCPHGTLVRVRALRGQDASEGSDVAVTPIMQRIRLTGIGRRGPVVANCTPDSSFIGGSEQIGWQVDASTAHRFKDAPRFNVAGPNLLQVTYLDEQDEWMIGGELYVRIAISVDEFSSSSSSSSSSSLSSSSSSSSSSSVSSSSLSSSSESSLSSSSMSNSLSTSSSSQSISTSSSSQSRSTSSSSGYDCFRFVESFCFDADTCVMTVTYGEACFPRGSGIPISHDVRGPACP